MALSSNKKGFNITLRKISMQAGALKLYSSDSHHTSRTQAMYTSL